MIHRWLFPSALRRSINCPAHAAAAAAAAATSSSSSRDPVRRRSSGSGGRSGGFFYPHLIRISRERPVVLAHMNFARLVAPMDDPRMDEFASAMGPSNDIAKSTPGFAWSLDDDDEEEGGEDECDGSGGRAGSRRQRDDVERLRDDPLLFPQLSLWHDVDSLRHFAYKSGHAMYYRRRKEWFEPHPDMEGPYSVCWWHRLTTEEEEDGGGLLVVRPPTLGEAFDRCDRLRADGPTAHAFDFSTHADFPMPSS